jgi:signal transduction histidine kinase
MIGLMKLQPTVLVVDDEGDVVKSLQDLLRVDYRVLGATRASDGLQLMEWESVDVVMTDQRMPDMSGVELLRRIRELHPDAIRLLFTGHADMAAVIDAINQGSIYRYISKPWDPEELQAVVKEAIHMRDVTAERDRLLVEMHAKNEELEAANRALSQMNELKSAFIRVASHELRTPLTALVGLSEMAHRHQDLRDPLRDWLGRIHTSANRLAHLVDQLTTMMIVGRFERPLERRRVDGAELLRRAVDDVRPFVELRRQTIELELAADLGALHVEEDKIRDAVGHLLINAIRFTPDGGKIRLVAHRVVGGVSVSVRDSGPGIPPTQIGRVFDPFFTGIETPQPAGLGKKAVGLGLSVVRSFIEMHGGHVTVESQAGSGSTFTAFIPDGGAEEASHA